MMDAVAVAVYLMPFYHGFECEVLGFGLVCLGLLIIY